MNHVEIARRLKAPSGKLETEIDEIFTLTIDGRLMTLFQGKEIFEFDTK